MKNLHAIEITYISPTNTRGSRVKINSLRFNSSKTIDYDYAMNFIPDMAISYLLTIGFSEDNFIGLAESKKGYIILTDRFEDIK